MFGFRKKKEPITTYEKFKCKCGCDLFSNTMKLCYRIVTYPDGYVGKSTQPLDSLLSCVECGSLYNQYGTEIEMNNR